MILICIKENEIEDYKDVADYISIMTMRRKAMLQFKYNHAIIIEKW